MLNQGWLMRDYPRHGALRELRLDALLQLDRLPEAHRLPRPCIPPPLSHRAMFANFLEADGIFLANTFNEHDSPQ